jgi:PAS domain S-box-containing protein
MSHHSGQSAEYLLCRARVLEQIIDVLTVRTEWTELSRFTIIPWLSRPCLRHGGGTTVTIDSDRKSSDRPSALVLRGEESERARRFRLFIESVQDYAIVILGTDGQVASWNAGAERIEGYAASEIVGKHFSVFYPPEDVAEDASQRLLDTALREARIEEEGWRIRKDGTRFWANVTVTALRDESTELLGFAMVTRDLTERKDAEEGARRFQLLVESVKDYAIFILDIGGRVATWNTGAERIKGYRASEIIGKHFSVFYPPEDVVAGKCEEELAIASDEGRFEEEGWRVRQDGTRFWASVTISALRDSQGLLVGYAKVTRDLTERRKAEAERLRLAQAQENERRNQEFLAIMGHELRNPLAPMVTALHRIRLLRGRNCEREISVLDRQLTQMTRLVNDLLDASRFVRNDVPLDRSVVELGEVLANAVEIAAPLVEEKRHCLHIDVGEGDLPVEVDRERLAQVFGNILTNAAKYTDPGGTISLSARDEGATVVVVVEDDGIGISPDLLPRIFDLFTQGEQGLDRRRGGLGIGLAVARRIVVEHGGTVVAESPGVGRGSRFIVQLPRSTKPVRRLPVSDSIPLRPALRPRRILVVDDNEDSAEMMALCLRDMGHTVEVAFDGTTALERAMSFTPEIIFLDVGLPGLTGYEVAERLRATKGWDKVRIVAITGFAGETDRARAIAAGFTSHMTKPVDLSQLSDQLEALDQP